MIHPTRFALPEEDYLTLLGEAVYVFNSNVSFFVENLLHAGAPDWYELADMMAGQLKDEGKKWLVNEKDKRVLELLCELGNERNRIIHSFPVTHDGRQELRTKTKAKDEEQPNYQYQIDRELLRSFIDRNQELSDELYECRDRNVAMAKLS
ncbi:MAG: hypothetical protein ACLVHF_04760 [Collinsella sp.]